MNIALADRMAPLAQEGIFSVLAQTRARLAAQGMDIIDLSVGSPDQAPEPFVITAMQEALSVPENFQYALTDRPALRQAAAAWYARRFQVELDPEAEIVSLLGSQDGLAHICLALINAGDTVLVHNPGYPVFHAGPQLAQAALYPMPQPRSRGYVVDLTAIPTEVAKRAKLMILNYPNNPTTVLAPEGFFQDVVAFARDYDLMVVHDNAYCELVFDGRVCGSFLATPRARDVGVEFNSLSKTYNFAGARMGFAMGNRDMVAALRLLKSHVDYGAFLPVQAGATALLTGPQSSVARTRATYEARRNMLCDGLTAAGWSVARPAATMFVWAPIPERYATSADFALQLAERTGVIVTPGEAFGPDGAGHVRMALVQSPERMAQAVRRVAESGVL